MHMVDANAYWVPPGQAFTIAGYSVPGGMLYCGFGLTATRGGTEPALVDIALPIDRAYPDWQGTDLPYWPAYATITPGARAAYLAWLADGRRFRAAPLAYVRLFFYGLERRVLRDMPGDVTARQELPAIRAEAERLLELYGRHRAFHTSARAFLDILDLMERDHSPGAPPAPGDDLALRLGLGWFAATASPVPVDWAEAWALSSLRRCPDEFGVLFRIRYTKKYGAGIVIPVGTARVRVDYRTASPGIGDVTLTLDTPDVLSLPGPALEMGELVGSVTNDLTPYGRWIARNPGGHGTLAEAALLPAELTSGRAGQVAVLRAWCEARLAAGSPTVVRGADLVGFWPAADPAGMTPAEASGLARLLARLGVGLEPDVRLGGPALTGGPAVLFRLSAAASGPFASASGPFAAARPVYSLAVALTRLALAVGGSSTGAPFPGVSLSPAELERLDAYGRWVAETGVDLPVRPGLLDDLDDGLRTRIAAAVTATVGDKACALLGVEPCDGAVDDSVGPVLAAVVSGLGQECPADEPVVGRHRATLDDVVPVAGLDRPHSRFLQLLAGRPSWDVVDFEELARRCRVLPAGAVDVINEAALDRAGDAVIDGDDLTVDVAVLEGMLR
jgi:hypothetical protein